MQECARPDSPAPPSYLPRLIKRSLPALPPPPAARPPDRPAPERPRPAARPPAASRGAQRGEGANLRPGRCSLPPGRGRGRGRSPGRRAVRGHREAPRPPLGSQADRALPVLRPGQEKGGPPRLGRRRGVGWERWLAFVSQLFPFLESGRRWPPLPMLHGASAQPARLSWGQRHGWGEAGGAEGWRTHLAIRPLTRGRGRGGPGCRWVCGRHGQSTAGRPPGSSRVCREGGRKSHSEAKALTAGQGRACVCEGGWHRPAGAWGVPDAPLGPAHACLPPGSSQTAGSRPGVVPGTVAAPGAGPGPPARPTCGWPSGVAQGGFLGRWLGSYSYLWLCHTLSPRPGHPWHRCSCLPQSWQ